MIANSGAEVAQPVEQRTENPCVGGSIPPLGTMNSQSTPLIAYYRPAGFFLHDEPGNLA